MSGGGNELHPQEVLTDLFGEEDFEEAIVSGDDERAAAMAVQRLEDAGFKIVDWKEARR